MTGYLNSEAQDVLKIKDRGDLSIQINSRRFRENFISKV
jgi:hypothetical protein